MHRTTLAACLSLSLVLAAGCGKKKGDASGPAITPAAPTAATPATAAKPVDTAPAPAPAPAAAGAPVKSTPKDLFAEFTDPKADTMALINKYENGATFSGVAIVKGTEGDGKPILWIDIDGKSHMTLAFTDVAQAKAIKNGDTVTVTCKIGGADADSHLMMVTDCANAK